MFRLQKKMVSKCTTSLSINERFTQLQGVKGQNTTQIAGENTIRETNVRIHQASIKNRRLAQQMERRPTVMAALKIKNKSIRQRLGPLDNGSSIQDRLQLPGPNMTRGRGRGLTRGLTRGQSRGLVRGQSRGLTRGQSRGLTRGQSRGLLRGRVGFRGQVSVLASPRGVRSLARGYRGKVVSNERGQLLNQLRETHHVGNQQLRRSVGGGRLRGGLQRGSGLRGGRSRGLQRGVPRGTGYAGVRRGQVVLQVRGQMRGGQVRRNQQGRGFEPRGRGFEPRGRGGRGRPQRARGYQQSNQRGSHRGFGRNQPDQPKPSKQELDNELDQYMSNS